MGCNFFLVEAEFPSERPYVAHWLASPGKGTQKVRNELSVKSAKAPCSPGWRHPAPWCPSGGRCARDLGPALWELGIRLSLQVLGAPDHAHVVLKRHFSLFPAGWASYVSTDSAFLISALLVYDVRPCVNTLCLEVLIPTLIPRAILPGSSGS